MGKEPGEILFEYLKAILFDTENASLDESSLPQEFHRLAEGLDFLALCVKEEKEFANELSDGNLNVKVPSRQNVLAAPLKNLHSSLLHMTWQTKQVAKGDYSQRIDFMGEFSEAFNSMVERLAEKEKADRSGIKEEFGMISESYTRNQNLLIRVMNALPDMVCVLSNKTKEALFENISMRTTALSHPVLAEQMIVILSEHVMSGGEERQIFDSTIRPHENEDPMYCRTEAHPFDWYGKPETVFLIRDTTDERREDERLQAIGNIDPLTGVYNRIYGVNRLQEYVDGRKKFSFAIVGLDERFFYGDRKLKSDQSRRLVKTASLLHGISDNVTVAKISNDEFLAVTEMPFQEFRTALEHIVSEKDSGLSCGCLEVDEYNTFNLAELMRHADVLMYQQRFSKKGIK